MTEEKLDLPLEKLYQTEGAFWANKKNGQLRYTIDDKGTIEWVSPLSTFAVGTNTPLKRGQAVSVGLMSQLADEVHGAAAVVPANPSVNQFAVGLLLESGERGATVHVQSHGQIEYDLSKIGDDRYYLPPHDSKRFLWTYNDIGSPVYVSAKAPGELTLDLAEATYNGAQILCVGRLADAPMANEKDQHITVEIALSGDVRGVVDTSRLTVHIEPANAFTVDKIQSNYDRIIAVKLVNGVGRLVTSDDVMRADAESDVIGVFVAPSVDGIVDLMSYYDSDVTVTRLGIIDGNFGFSSATFGRTAYLNGGEIDFESVDSTVEYKVGVGWGSDRFLVDCRYSKQVQLTEMVGTIKPIFEGGTLDVGYVRVDSDPHQVSEEWRALLSQCYSKDIFLFAESEDGPWTRFLEGGWTAEKILDSATYFKFRDLYYSTNGDRTACQIKVTKEGSPESQAYVWPEQCYQLTVPAGQELAGGRLNKSTLRLNITHLVQLGAYMDNNGQNIEAYDVIVQEKESKQVITPGFWQNKAGFWCGYEWQTVTSNGQTYLMMITVPEGASEASCYGVTWPIGQKLTKSIELFVTVRRRPTQYNTLYLNQYPEVNPWTPLVDSANNLVIQGDKIYLGGKIERNDGSSGFTREEYQSIISVGYGKEAGQGGITYKILPSDGTKITSFVESFVIGDGDDQRSVTWTYDMSGKNTVAELDAQFSADFTAQSTKNEENLKNYNDSALRIFHALYPQIFRRKATGQETISITYARIAEFMRDGYTYEVFDRDQFPDLKSTPVGNLVSVANGDDQIGKALDVVWPDKDRLVFQSYLGLLAKAAAETDARLERIERAMYGADKDSERFSLYIDGDGILRFFDFMQTFGLYSTDESLSKYAQQTTPKGVASLLYSFIVENYGPYGDKENTLENAYEDAKNIKSIEDFEDFFNQNILRDITFKKRSHLVDLWYFYKSLDITNAIMNNVKVIHDRHYDTFEDFTAISSKSIVPLKISKGYRYESSYGDPDAPKGAAGSPFCWPIDKSSDWEKSFIDVEDSFFNTEIFGATDGHNDSEYEDDRYYEITDLSNNDHYTGTRSTFGAQTLEGILYDIIIKLSYVRHLFYDDKHVLKSEVSSLMPFFPVEGFVENFVKYGKLLYEPLTINYSRQEPFYSAFTFENDKLKEAYSLVLDSKWNDNLITSKDFQNEVVSQVRKLKNPLTLKEYTLTSPLQIFALYFIYGIVLNKRDSNYLLVKGDLINSIDKLFPKISNADKNSLISAIDYEVSYVSEEDNGKFAIEYQSQSLPDSTEDWIETIMSPIVNVFFDDDSVIGSMLGGSTQGDHFAILKILATNEISPSFIESVFGTWASYLHNGNDWIPTPVVGTEKTYRQWIPIFEEIYPLLVEDLPKHKLHFEFLDGTTNTESVLYDNDRTIWQQKPIANNGLVWRDINGGTHSCDFNDFINKSVSNTLDAQAADFYQAAQKITSETQVGEVLDPVKEGKPLIGVTGAMLSAQERADQDGYFFDRDCFVDGWVNEAPAASVPSGGILAVSSQNKAYGTSGVDSLLDVTYDTIMGVRVVTGVSMRSHSHTVTVPEKSYATRTVRRDQILTRDAFNRAPIIRKAEVASIDRFDFSKNFYTFKTETLKPVTYETPVTARKFAFKDESYINGRILPSPDVKLTLQSKDIRRLFDQYVQKEPALYPKKFGLNENIMISKQKKIYELNAKDGMSLKIRLDDDFYIECSKFYAVLYEYPHASRPLNIYYNLYGETAIDGKRQLIHYGKDLYMQKYTNCLIIPEPKFKRPEGTQSRKEPPIGIMPVSVEDVESPEKMLYAARTATPPEQPKVDGSIEIDLQKYSDFIAQQIVLCTCPDNLFNHNADGKFYFEAAAFPLNPIEVYNSVKKQIRILRNWKYYVSESSQTSDQLCNAYHDGLFKDCIQ